MLGRAGRARLGEDSWLWEDEEFAGMVVVAWLAEEEAVVDLETVTGGFWGGKAGSGGGDWALGDCDASFCLHTESVRGKALSGGVHCVPASLVCFDGDVDDVDKGRL